MSSHFSVFIIEDSIEDTKLLKAKLQAIETEKTLEIETANTFLRAKKMLGSPKFNLILLDLNLPDNWGISTVSDCVKLAKGSNIVVLTSMAHELTIEEAKKAGASLVFMKHEMTEDKLGEIVNSL